MKNSWKVSCAKKTRPRGGALRIRTTRLPPMQGLPPHRRQPAGVEGSVLGVLGSAMSSDPCSVVAPSRSSSSVGLASALYAVCFAIDLIQRTNSRRALRLTPARSTLALGVGRGVGPQVAEAKPDHYFLLGFDR